MEPRFDEVFELSAEERDHLTALGFSDVVIQPVNVSGNVSWAAEVFIDNGRWNFAWALDLRPSRDEARAAARCLLQGLVRGRLVAREQHPATVFDDPDDVERAQHAHQNVLAYIEDGYAARRETLGLDN
jgi:hypothetical protein